MTEFVLTPSAHLSDSYPKKRDGGKENIGGRKTFTQDYNRNEYSKDGHSEEENIQAEYACPLKHVIP